MEELLTRAEFHATIDKLTSEVRMLKRNNERKTSEFISRREIINDIGELEYYRAVDNKELTPIKFGDARNCKVRVLTAEYNRYILNKANKQ